MTVAAVAAASWVFIVSPALALGAGRWLGRAS